MSRNPPLQAADRKLAETIRSRVDRGVQVRRSLAPDGRVHIDRQLPFLVVYRTPDRGPEPALRKLVSSGASYLIAPSTARGRRLATVIVQDVAELQSRVFGGFLLVEIWEGSWDHQTSDTDLRPAFRVFASKDLVSTPSVQELVSGLGHVEILGRRAEVEVVAGAPPVPTGLPRLLPVRVARDSNTHVVGLAAAPFWRDPETGEPFPLVRRSFTRQVTHSIQRSAFVFAKGETISRPLHYQALGRRAVVRAVRQIDLELAGVAESFSLLLAVTPTNGIGAWRRFRRDKGRRPPRFEYRAHTVDPSLLKRRLFDIRIERVEDPTLESLFREKRAELELELSLIGSRLTARFLPTSVALYGAVDEGLVARARQILDQLPLSEGRRRHHVSAASFAAAAERELDHYRSVDPSISPRVELRDDVSVLMVSSGILLVGGNMTIPTHRVDALLQHEIGTHVVTYWNGRAQAFQLLGSGLAHHDELQEGLAVIAEYLVGGLTAVRMRALAARVLAADAVARGAEFIDTYRLLTDDLGISDRTAFFTAMRVHRGGGFVKDAVYLRGLQGVMEYVRRGGRLDTLIVGKIATEHTGIIEELQRREVLGAPTLRPRFLDHPDSHYRIERIRAGLDYIGLVDPE